MYKYAGELKRKDKFLMAGGCYTIIDVQETYDEDMVRLIFTPVNTMSDRRNVLTLDRSYLFITV